MAYADEDVDFASDGYYKVVRKGGEFHMESQSRGRHAPFPKTREPRGLRQIQERI